MLPAVPPLYFSLSPLLSWALWHCRAHWRELQRTSMDVRCARGALAVIMVIVLTRPRIGCHYVRAVSRTEAVSAARTEFMMIIG